MTQQHYQHTCRSAAEALAAVCLVSITLTSCAGNALNGHPAPSLSTSAPDSATTPGSASQTQAAASKSEPTSQQVTRGSNNVTQPATTQPSRPYRPPSVIARVFHTSLLTLCTTIAAGSSDTILRIQRFVPLLLCFTGLDTSVPPSLVVTTPEGIRETMTLTSDNGEWEGILIPVPGQGAEASLGEYSFQVTTPIPGSASPSPTAGVMTTSGHFTVMPDARPGAEIGGASMVSARQVSLPTGSRLYVWFSGFPDFSMVYVTLYGPCAAQGCPLLVDLPGVRADQHGEGTVSWAIPSGAALSEYFTWIDPMPASCRNPCLAFTITQ